MLLELHGIVEVDLSEEEFSDLFIDFIESLNASFGGGIVTVEEEEE